MNQLNEVNAEFLRDHYCADIEREAGTTARVLAAVPVEGQFAPHERSRSADQLVKHIATSDIWFLRGVAEGKLDPASMAGISPPQEPAAVSTWYVEETRAGLDRIRSLSGERLVQIIDFRGLASLPAVMYLSFQLKHSIHHRGQLSTYLRPLGSKVPIIYGRSADEG